MSKKTEFNNLVIVLVVGILILLLLARAIQSYQNEKRQLKKYLNAEVAVSKENISTQWRIAFHDLDLFQNSLIQGIQLAEIGMLNLPRDLELKLNTMEGNYRIPVENSILTGYKIGDRQRLKEEIAAIYSNKKIFMKSNELRNMETAYYISNNHFIFIFRASQNDFQYKEEYQSLVPNYQVLNGKLMPFLDILQVKSPYMSPSKKIVIGLSRNILVDGEFRGTINYDLSLIKMMSDMKLSYPFAKLLVVDDRGNIHFTESYAIKGTSSRLKDSFYFYDQHGQKINRESNDKPILKRGLSILNEEISVLAPGYRLILQIDLEQKEAYFRSIMRESIILYILLAITIILGGWLIIILVKTRRISMYDPLTNLYNRSAFYKYLPKCMGKSKGCVLIMDLDHFKKINDTYGHGVGDDVIKEVARTIQQGMVKNGLISRYGGEEFLGFIPNFSLEQGVKLANDIRQSVRMLKINQITPTISIGVSYYPHDSYDSIKFDQCISQADAALYEAKNNGRNCVKASGATIN